MKNMDQALLREWVDLDLEGELPETDRERLHHAVAHDPELQREQQALRGLQGMFRDGRVDVRPQFTDDVMGALPVAAWHTAAAGRWPAWALPAALVVVMAVASSWVFAGNLSGSHLLETGTMLADLIQTSILAGSGLLFATWRGVGLGVEEMIADSTANLVAFGVLVLCVNLLFISFLRRRRPAAVTVDSAASRDD